MELAPNPTPVSVPKEPMVDRGPSIEPCDQAKTSLTTIKNTDLGQDVPEVLTKSGLDVKSEIEASPPYAEKDAKPDIKPEGSSKRTGTIAAEERDKVCFAYGPRDNYFFGCGGNYSYRGIYHGEIKKLGLEIPYTVALGEYGQLAGRYFVACQAKGNAPGWSYMFEIEKPNKPNKLKADAKKKWLDDQAAQKKFQDWTKTLPTTLEGLRQTSVAFGPGTSFFACSPTSCEFHGLPVSLETRIKEYEKRGQPKQVALGIYETWVAIWPDGSFAYDLSKHMGASRLLTLLKEAKAGSISFVALSPFSIVDWFLETSDGIISYGIDTGIYKGENRRTIDRLACATIQARVREDGRTHTWSTTTASGASMVVISPETNHTFVAYENNPDEQAQKQAEMLEVSNKAAKKSIKASHVAIAAAAVTLCTVM